MTACRIIHGDAATDLTPTRPVLRWHGGKWKSAKRIIAHFPPHRVYVEPYGGAASVLMQKPRVYAEVYNDLDGDVVNLFRVLRDQAQSEDLINRLRLTPFAREEFEMAYVPCSDPVELARRMIVRSFMGFGSGASNRDYQTGFRRKSFRSGTCPSWDFRNYPECVPAFVERLRGVAVENRPAIDVIGAMDREDVLYYVDPPYVRSTRCQDSNGDVYRNEMSDDDHREMAEALRKAKGMVILSGYRSDLYDEIFQGWSRIEFKAHADKGRSRTECLWFNKAAYRARPRAVALRLDVKDREAGRLLVEAEG